MARKSDDFDSTLTNIAIFIYVLLLTFALFASDWWFGKTYLTETLIGILIGAPLGWCGCAVNHFFRDKDIPGTEVSDDEGADKGNKGRGSDGTP